MKTNRSAQFGVGMLDALIALVILSFGMLAMTRFQTRLVGNATDAQSRLTAAALADELLNTAMVDGQVNNRPCYTWPVAGACPTPGAAARTQAWETRVRAALPVLTGPTGVTSVYVPATGMMTVTIQWTGKSRANFNGQSTAETRRMEMSSNVN